MRKVSAFLRRWPRVSAALGFGTAGIALSTLWWSPVIFQAQSALPYALFIILPGVSAAIAGCVLGKPLLDASQVLRPGIEALRGRLLLPWHCCSSRHCLLHFTPVPARRPNIGTYSA